MRQRHRANAGREQLNTPEIASRTRGDWRRYFAELATIRGRRPGRLWFCCVPCHRRAFTWYEPTHRCPLCGRECKRWRVAMPRRDTPVRCEKCGRITPDDPLICRCGSSVFVRVRGFKLTADGYSTDAGAWRPTHRYKRCTKCGTARQGHIAYCACGERRHTVERSTERLDMPGTERKRKRAGARAAKRAPKKTAKKKKTAKRVAKAKKKTTPKAAKKTAAPRARRAVPSETQGKLFEVSHAAEKAIHDESDKYRNACRQLDAWKRRRDKSRARLLKLMRKHKLPEFHSRKVDLERETVEERVKIRFVRGSGDG